MLLLSLLLHFYASADIGKCTEWSQDKIEYCNFNGTTAKTWNRTCLNKNDLDTLCWTENPDNIKSDCSEWIQKREKCSLASGKFGDLWIRQCKTLNDKTKICVDVDPNTIK